MNIFHQAVVGHTGKKQKKKFTLEQAMKDERGSRGIAVVFV
jgi:hypothetical protein